MHSPKIITELRTSAKLLDSFLDNKKNISLISDSATMLAEAFKQGGKVFSCGNGGSHCDAMHFAEELTGKYREKRPALPAIAISDVSHISCVGNDYGYDYIFSRYLEALANEKDILFCLSSSGNSKNIIEAIKMAKNLGMKVISLTGRDGGEILPLTDININVSYHGYADRIQEIHIKIIHILIMLIEIEMK